MSSVAPNIEDPTIYPVEERVGEDILQRLIVELLRPLIERWLASRGPLTFVGADQFIYYEQFNPTRRVAPDVYVLPGVDPDTEVASWKVWESGIVPSFALEVVSKNWRKDYDHVPPAYAELGIDELIIFDPRYNERREGLRWQCFRRVGNQALRLVEHTNLDRIASTVLGCQLCAMGFGSKQRIRLIGEQGELFLTAEEAERAAREAERAAKEAALARVAELEAKLKTRGQ